MYPYQRIILFILVIGTIGLVSHGYGEVSQLACFNYDKTALESTTTESIAAPRSEPRRQTSPQPSDSQTSAEVNSSSDPQSSPQSSRQSPKSTSSTPSTLGQGFIIDHDHGALGFGQVLQAGAGLVVPYIGIGEAFTPSGITWEFGVAYCYEQYSLRLGYEATYNIPSDDREELFPVIQKGYFINKLVAGPVLLTLLLKYGEFWEHYRSESDDDYYKTLFPGAELGFFIQTPVFKTRAVELGFYTYSVATYLANIDEWTILSFINFDFTLWPRPFGEGKVIHGMIHAYSSDPSRVLEIKSMFFLSPFPVNTPRRFNKQATAGSLAGSFAFGYRVFPFYKLRPSSAERAEGFYLAPYIHYGWGVDRFKPRGNVKTSVSVVLHLGYKLSDGGSLSTAVGWNNEEGVVISIIANF